MNTTTPSPTPRHLPAAALPWWRYRMAWLVLGLPASAVIAATASAVVAVRHADPVVEEARPTGGRTALEPAEAARNHAATPRR